VALFPFSLPSANGTPSLHLYLPHLPMSRIFRSRESASDDRSPGGLPGRSGRTRARCAGVHEHAWGQGPSASRGTSLELRDVLVGALAASHTGLKRVLGRLDLNRRRLGGTLGPRLDVWRWERAPWPTCAGPTVTSCRKVDTRSKLDPCRATLDAGCATWGPCCATWGSCWAKAGAAESSAKRNESPEDERRMTEPSSCRPPIPGSFKQISLPKRRRIIQSSQEERSLNSAAFAGGWSKI